MHKARASQEWLKTTMLMSLRSQVKVQISVQLNLWGNLKNTVHSRAPCSQTELELQRRMRNTAELMIKTYSINTDSWGVKYALYANSYLITAIDFWARIFCCSVWKSQKKFSVVQWCKTLFGSDLSIIYCILHWWILTLLSSAVPWVLEQTDGVAGGVRESAGLGAGDR